MPTILTLVDVQGVQSAAAVFILWAGRCHFSQSAVFFFITIHVALQVLGV
jgi:hypothetical protein